MLCTRGQSGSFVLAAESVPSRIRTIQRASADGGTGLYGIGADQSNGTYGDAATRTRLMTSHGQASSTLYETGTSGNGSFAYGSVVYQTSASGSYTTSDATNETWTGSGTDSTTNQNTETRDGLTGTAQTSDNGPFSYTLASLSTATTSGSSGSHEYRAGQYANGSFSYDSYTRDAHAANSQTFDANMTFSRTATGTWMNDGQGISTRGVNGTFLYSATGSTSRGETQDGNNCFTLHEEGTYAGGSYNLGCMVEDSASSFTAAMSYAGGDSATNTTGFSAEASFSGSSGQWRSSSLHQEGTYASNTWNIGSFVRHQNSLASSSSERIDDQSATGESSLGTTTAWSLSTYNLYEAGQHSGGSYSFGSMSLESTTASQNDYQETGSNATFSAYSRDDLTCYSYGLTETGTGTVGSYSENSLETISHSFNGTYSAGGTINTSSLNTVGYSVSGIYNLSSGVQKNPAPSGLPLTIAGDPNFQRALSLGRRQSESQMVRLRDGQSQSPATNTNGSRTCNEQIDEGENEIQFTSEIDPEDPAAPVGGEKGKDKPIETDTIVSSHWTSQPSPVFEYNSFFLPLGLADGKYGLVIFMGRAYATRNDEVKVLTMENRQVVAELAKRTEALEKLKKELAEAVDYRSIAMDLKKEYDRSNMGILNGLGLRPPAFVLGLPVPFVKAATTSALPNLMFNQGMRFSSEEARRVIRAYDKIIAEKEAAIKAAEREIEQLGRHRYYDTFTGEIQKGRVSNDWKAIGPHRELYFKLAPYLEVEAEWVYETYGMDELIRWLVMDTDAFAGSRVVDDEFGPIGP